jgi:two-component sensor histidine kinase
MAAWQAAVASGTDFHAEFRIRRHDGEYRWFDTRAVRVTDAAGATVKWFGSNTDITEQREAGQKIRAALAEKEVMMREIHHRVKNNLQMMSALLELQAGYVQDEQVRDYFRDSQRRIQSMAMVHEQLYHTENMAQIDFVAYLNTLIDNLRGQYAERCNQVAIRIDANACVLPVDTAIPCGLVLSELVSNAMKHAFPNGRSGELLIKLDCANPGKVILEVADNGVGLPAGLDVQHSNSFGLRLISLMVERQLHGKLKIESNNGTRVVCELGA